jgi:tRNA wybutosine-synthesizing protein 3
MDKNEYFLISKEKALNKLNKAKSEYKTDEDIEEIINLINSKRDYFTSSSCAGRIVIIELPELGDKKEAKFLGKWHRVVEYSEINKSIKQAKSGMVWFLAQSPILHVVTKSSLSADKLIKIAISSGFKNSGIKSLSSNIIIEICSTERLDAPIGNNGYVYCNQEHLNFLVDISNHIIFRSKKKLRKFENNLKNLEK